MQNWYQLQLCKTCATLTDINSRQETAAAAALAPNSNNTPELFKKVSSLALSTISDLATFQSWKLFIVSTFCLSATMKQQKDAKQVIIEWKIGCCCVSFSESRSKISTCTSNLTDDETLKMVTLKLMMMKMMTLMMMIKMIN